MRYSHIKSNQAESYGLKGGETTRILATAVNTDGRVSIFDSYLPAGNAAPWHYHEIDDEIFYIISGEVEFGIADEELVATSGDLVIAGPMVKRRFKALSDSQVLVINVPAGPSEGFIREISEFGPDKPPTDQDKQRFINKYKIHIL